MIKITITILLINLFNHAGLAQKSGKDEVNFSDPYQIDSSAYFLIPKLVDNDNAAAFGKGKGYLPWGHYSDVFFYNSATNQVNKLFGGQLALINPFFARRNYYSNEKEKELPDNILSRHIIYLVRTSNFNRDNALDTEDPVYLYVSTKTGEKLRQLTPENFNVVSWTLSKDGKLILVKGQNDTNGNKKFGNGDDELYYRIDLNDDISKITCDPITL